jgi:drug/metabolite transporter (DMT)-like permease
VDQASQRRRAILFLILAATLWSTGGLMIKSTSWQPLGILVGRNIFSSVVLLLYLRRFPMRLTRWKLVAAVSHILTAFLFISSTRLTTAANAIFLQYTAPIYIVILGFWFLHESPTRTDWISMPIIFGGMLLFLGDRLSLDSVHGIFLAVLSGMTMAMMTVALRAQKDGTPAESILLGQLFTVLVGIPLILRESWTAANLLIIAYLGIFQIGFAFLLFTNAIKHVPAIEATLISTLEPILNPVWVLLFNGERPGMYAVLGGLVVLAGICVNAVGSARAVATRASAAS